MIGVAFITHRIVTTDNILKGALYTISCGVNRLGDCGVKVV